MPINTAWFKARIADKRLSQRGLMRGRWDLAGPARDARAVDLEYAAPVLLIIT